MQEMYIRDEIAERTLELMRQEVQNGADFTVPWLDLDVEAYRAYREGKTSLLPTPYCDDHVHRMMMQNVQGKHVLCLAGGGGQQSAVFSLLGADVTVLDLTPEQLEADERAAERYGYTVRTVQGDMRDLSTLPTAYFDRVYQPISTLYVPDLRKVNSGVARILKPGGLYFSCYVLPLLMMAENKGWDGRGYTLYITEPYVHGAILETKDGKMNLKEGESFSEFHHLFSDILNGLVEELFIIRAVWENPRPDRGAPLEELEPGSEAHRARFIPRGLALVAERAGPKDEMSGT